MTDGFLSLCVINDKFWQPAQFHLVVAGGSLKRQR
jgi:hypothetical protein